MTQKITTALLAGLVALVCVPTAAADLIWTGAADGRFLFVEDNWEDHAGLIPPRQSINQNQLITANTGGTIRIDSGTGTPDNFSSNFVIGNNALVVANQKTLAGNGSIIGTGSSVTITNQASVHVSSIENSDITLSGQSTLQLSDSRDSLEGSTVNVLDAGSRVIFDNESYLSFANEYVTRMMFRNESLRFGADPLALEAGDNAWILEMRNGSNVAPRGIEIVFSAIPEPSSLILLMLGTSWLLARRRHQGATPAKTGPEAKRHGSQTS